ncbi:hypothetical protein SLEP1_g45566 [Rubroshorea leprosula]|uniref:Uncharacterized protein n=1 Tax=Rubroshorea leprosula TaxID=152421 RepID=A0AAV5LK77_9ROSI|nr:hypothetical protein SLEP1_g45566 [Rubroshorea leprosula]
MRSLARCYNEHAIKVSDSYCSGPSNRAYLSPNMTSAIPNTITCIYRARLSSGCNLLITLTWCNRATGNGLTIQFSKNPFSSPSISDSDSYRLKKNRGSELFQFCNSIISVSWDLSDAQYSNGPEPENGFYILVLVDSEICLLLGDMEEEAKENQTIHGIGNFSLVSRRENFSGCSVYSTKARFCDTGEVHEILIKCGGEGGEGLKNQQLSVSIDKKMIFQVKRLAWNFRGNQAIYLDNGLLVDMMWDLHDWLFNPAAAAAGGHAVFMFRTRSGLDSRLWLEEKSSDSKDKDKAEFSLLICACKNPD